MTSNVASVASEALETVGELSFWKEERVTVDGQEQCREMQMVEKVSGFFFLYFSSYKYQFANYLFE